LRAHSWALTGAALTLTVAAPLVLAHHAGFLATTQIALVDFLFKTRASQPARSTVIVGIDQRSYQALLATHGPLSQWPRTLYAQALDALREPAAGDVSAAPGRVGPRVVAFEVFFDGARSEDAELAQAMLRSGNVVTPVVAQGERPPDPDPGVPRRFDAFLRPSPGIRGTAAGEGLANVTVSPDSVVRGLPLLLRAGGERLPAMALTLAALYARRPNVLDAEPGPGVVHAAGRAIPVSEGQIMAINFLGPPSSPDGKGPFQIIPFVDVLEGRFDRSVVRDRIVLIGPTIRGVDEHPTPTSTYTSMWGVEILANAVETVVHQRYLVTSARWMTVLGIILMISLAALVTHWASPWLAGLAVGALLTAYVTAAVIAFDSGLVLNLVYPPAGVLAGFAVTLAHRVVFAEKDRRMAREAMERYLSPAIGRWVLEDPRRLTLGGELREMTVLFTDLREFTTLSHDLPPETLVALLNRYRSIMSDVVFAHDGVIVQFAGDAIEAFWNAPMAQPDHARRACRAALGMTAALQALRPEFEARGWEGLDIGIGINTGRMVVGNFGSRRRLEYAVVGDPVNVAARLEGLTKVYGVRVIAGDDTRAAAGDAFVWRFLDLVAVKGRREPLRVWEVAGPADHVDAENQLRLERYQESVDLYRTRRFAEAERLLAALAVDMPGDGPVELYLERSRAARLTPPPDDWDGVHIARIK
jgi:adenylate cyclase